MKKEELEGLGEKIRIATDAGMSAANACESDGGSANCDRVVIRIPGVRESVIKRLELPGYIYEASNYHGRGLHLPTPWGGIGARNCAGVEAMNDSLKAQGVDCYVYYQID